MNRGFGPLRLPDLPEVPVPVGQTCFACGEPIGPGDSGTITSLVGGDGVRRLPIHRECEIRSIIGSVGHQRGLCTCNGGPGTLDDPPGVSRRVAALLAEREALLRSIQTRGGSTHG